MFKKAGIVAAATTAVLLALSPLAFADESAVSIDDSQVNKCSATQTNDIASTLNVNNELQCTNIGNRDSIQTVTLLGGNTIPVLTDN